MLSRVDLPLPEAPSSTTNSPRPTSRSTERSACTAESPLPYTLDSAWARSTGSMSPM
jgi:hypothetical protein